MTDKQQNNKQFSLSYFRSHRLALELKVSCRVSAVAMYIYDYIAHNANVTSGISHKIQIKDLAEFVDRTKMRIYQCLDELAEAGLIVIRSKCSESGWVFQLPCIEAADRSAKKSAIEAQHKKELVQIDEMVDTEILKYEKKRGRELTISERAAVRRNVEKRRNASL